MTATRTRRYYVTYPRDFANEYLVDVISAADEALYREINPEAVRITRREAVRLGRTRPAEARRNGEQWYGGFSSDGYGGHGDRLDVAGHIAASEEVSTAVLRMAAEDRA